MAMLSQYPMFDEWLVTLQTNPELAEQHMKYLRWQAAAEGLYAQPVLISSIQDYERAQAQLTAMPAPPSPEAITTATTSAPQCALDPYPDAEQWQTLIAADASAALRQLGMLKLQAAQLGEFNTPFVLHASIEAYTTAQDSLAAAQSPHQGSVDATAPDAQQIETEKQPWWKRLLGS